MRCPVSDFGENRPLGVPKPRRRSLPGDRELSGLELSHGCQARRCGAESEDAIITYRVSSGDMKVTVETPHESVAQQIAAIAIDRMVHKKKAPKKLGRLIEVSGGQYSGDHAMYFSSENILKSIGRME